VRTALEQWSQSSFGIAAIALDHQAMSKCRMSDWTREIFNHVYVKTEGQATSIQLTRRECQLAVQLLELKTSDHILDLACGHGRHSIELARRGFENITGLDFSNDAIAQARADAVGTNAKFVLGDMKALSFEQEFDAVLSFFNSIFFWDDQTHLRILQGIHRALKPGGRLFLDSHNPFFMVHGILLRQSRVFGRILAIRKQLSLWNSWLRRSIQNPGQPKAWFKTIADFDPNTGFLRGVKHLHTGTEQESHPFELRLYTFTEVKNLLERAGFEVEKVVSNEGRVFLNRSPRFVVIALKKC
jgi:SAM-dependent methyltransferase